MKKFLILMPVLMFLGACAPGDYSARDRKETLDRFQSRFNASRPNCPISNELLNMGAQYGVGQGWDMDSQAGVAKVEQLLKTVAQDSRASSHWLFRGIFHVAGQTNAFTKTVYGLATVSQANADMTMICDSKEASLRFVGISTGGRLSGTIVISAGAVDCKGKAEGSIVPCRISLDTQGENASELIRGSFVFLR